MTTPVTAEPAEHFADLKSFRVHSWEAGTGHPVLLHGGGRAPGQPSGLRPGLEPDGHRVDAQHHRHPRRVHPAVKLSQACSHQTIKGAIQP